MERATTLFWGKARPMAAGAATHPLVAHALDVAAVAMLLPHHAGSGLPNQALGFLVALHDIGKFAASFQALAPACWPEAALGVLPASLPVAPRHDALGLHLLRGPLAEALDPVLPPRRGERRAWTHALRGPLLRALAGHHGSPPAEGATDPGPAVLGPRSLAAAGDFVSAMLRLFGPPSLPAPANDRAAARLGWHLAGRATLADWIGSRQAWFPYVRPEEVADPAAYFWDHALPRAAAALAAAGLATAAPAPFRGLGGLFPTIATPSPMQRWAETVDLPPGPVLAVVEDVTGSGKTEAALTLAHRLLAAGRARGIFLALPTMATANGMFGRLAGAYHRLFTAEAHPSLALAHGRALLDTRFRATIPAEVEPPQLAAPELRGETAEAHCAAWLAEDRRRAMLAQVGVGTLDQALLAVLPVQHAALRLQGLAGKVLVIDEVHAFDAYMQREILTLLQFHAALGGSVVLLSATLPREIRRKLVGAFLAGLEAPVPALARQDYPLVTLATAGGVTESPCAPREGLPRRVAVTRLGDAGAALDRIQVAAETGAAVAWVRNTVDDAIAAAAALRARGIEAMLFHARFAMADRLEIEAEVLRRFGRDSRDRAGVLVATQVVEQSLDLDFDLLVSDLAPVDLLIQRAGRLWRHERDGRPVAGPDLLVVSPEPVAEPAEDWIKAALPGTAAVYRDPALLWRGARALFLRGALATPGDMRPLIEAAFDGTAPGAVPPALARAAERAEGRNLAAADTARMNLLDFARCYSRDAGFWEPETQTPTRLEEEPQVTLRLALRREDRIIPYAGDADPRRAWALSEVVVPRRRIAACPLPAELEAAAAAARAGWGRWERESSQVLLALLTPQGGGASLHGQIESGDAVAARYDARLGLVWDSPATAG